MMVVHQIFPCLFSTKLLAHDYTPAIERSRLLCFPAFPRNITLPVLARHHRSALTIQQPSLSSHAVTTSESSDDGGATCLPAAPAVGCSSWVHRIHRVLRSRLVIPSSSSKARPCSVSSSMKQHRCLRFFPLECS